MWLSLRLPYWRLLLLPTMVIALSLPFFVEFQISQPTETRVPVVLRPKRAPPGFMVPVGGPGDPHCGQLAHVPLNPQGEKKFRLESSQERTAWMEKHQESALGSFSAGIERAFRCPNGDAIPLPVCSHCEGPAGIWQGSEGKGRVRQQSCLSWGHRARFDWPGPEEKMSCLTATLWRAMCYIRCGRDGG